MQWLILALQYGIPQVMQLVVDLKAKNGADPTADEVRKLMEGVRPPTDYGVQPPAA